mmetsp:Transcript_8630/g.15631  ORF Transcript_8630/g.15631 Transcript_8630/m.15631 type:complete len:186 (-) Transcript_8630:42-599(-)
MISSSIRPSSNSRRSSWEHSECSDERNAKEDINYINMMISLGANDQDVAADETAGTPNAAIRNQSDDANAEDEALWAPGENSQDDLFMYANFGFHDSLTLTKERGVRLSEELYRGIEEEDEVNTVRRDFNSSFRQGLSLNTGQYRTGIRRGSCVVPTKVIDGKVRPKDRTKIPAPKLSNSRATAA